MRLTSLCGLFISNKHVCNEIFDKGRHNIQTFVHKDIIYILGYGHLLQKRALSKSCTLLSHHDFSA